MLILSAPCIVKPPPSPGAKFSQGRSGSPAIGTPSIFSSSTAQPLASTSARIDLLTVDGSAARVYLGPALVESSSNPHRHGAVQEHARRSRSRAGNEDRWPVAGSEIHAACRGPAAQPATTALPRSHRGTARWGWRCTSEPGRRTNVDVEARCDEAGTARPSWRRGRRRHHEDTTGGSDVKPMPPPRRRRGMRRRQNGSRCCDAGPGYHKTPLRRRPEEPCRAGKPVRRPDARPCACMRARAWPRAQVHTYS